jgi:uncharacterized protein (DUF2267 family)
VATQRNGPPVDLSYPDGWRYEQFIVTIQQKADVSWAEAETAVRATLGTLGERISRGDARALAGDLPGDLRSWLLDAGGADAEPFDAAEFVRRVAAREGVDLETAERHVRAVFVALARLVRRPEMSHLLAELPDDYAALLGDAASRTRDPGAPEVLAYEQFLQRVADRAALFPEQAGEVAAAGYVVITPSCPRARGRWACRRAWLRLRRGLIGEIVVASLARAVRAAAHRAADSRPWPMTERPQHSQRDARAWMATPAPDRPLAGSAVQARQVDTNRPPRLAAGRRPRPTGSRARSARGAARADGCTTASR